jgi:hypothetical protein
VQRVGRAEGSWSRGQERQRAEGAEGRIGIGQGKGRCKMGRVWKGQKAEKEEGMGTGHWAVGSGAEVIRTESCRGRGRMGQRTGEWNAGVIEERKKREGYKAGIIESKRRSGVCSRRDKDKKGRHRRSRKQKG